MKIEIMKCELFLVPIGIEENSAHGLGHKEEVFVMGVCCVAGTNIQGKAKICITKEMAQQIRLKRGQAGLKITVELVEE